MRPGWWTRRRLARLIAHAERAQAKLVLVGDPEQLGEIEAGGLFRALADRTDPIHLDEVIRHEHELDREAAKRIREGEGREALGLYRSEERVTVAPNAEARREAMVSDWHRVLRARRGRRDGRQAKRRGREAERDGARGPHARRASSVPRRSRSAARPSPPAIRSSPASTTAKPPSTTASAGRSPRSTPREHRVVLDGIDQPRQVEVGADYLARTNPHSDAPALEHAYAVTTYSAQGTTVDRAYVMADPSMDKQELYVATSRSREETCIYATPEIQAHREEIAPQLAVPARGHPPHRRSRRARPRPARRARHRSARSSADRGAGAAAPELALPAADEQRAEAKGLPAVERTARTELVAIESLLAERRQLAITTARISPPPYIRTDLGERPSDPRRSKAWDRGARAYRALPPGERGQGQSPPVWPRGEAGDRARPATEGDATAQRYPAGRG